MTLKKISIILLILQLNIIEVYASEYGKVKAIGIAGSSDHVYAWFKNKRVTSGTSQDFDRYSKQYSYSLASGKQTYNTENYGKNKI